MMALILELLLLMLDTHGLFSRRLLGLQHALFEHLLLWHGVGSARMVGLSGFISRIELMTQDRRCIGSICKGQGRWFRRIRSCCCSGYGR